MARNGEKTSSVSAFSLNSKGYRINIYLVQTALLSSYVILSSYPFHCHCPTETCMFIFSLPLEKICPCVSCICSYAILHTCCAWPRTCWWLHGPAWWSPHCWLGFTGLTLSPPPRDGWQHLSLPASAASVLLALPTPRNAILSLWLVLETCLSMQGFQLNCAEIHLLLLLSTLLGSIFKLTIWQAA